MYNAIQLTYGGFSVAYITYSHNLPIFMDMLWSTNRLSSKRRKKDLLHGLITEFLMRSSNFAYGSYFDNVFLVSSKLKTVKITNLRNSNKKVMSMFVHRRKRF